MSANFSPFVLSEQSLLVALRSSSAISFRTSVLQLTRSHGWRWVDRSGWSVEEEVDNIHKAVDGRSNLIYISIQKRDDSSR